ncbi:hypothetical protein JCM6882_001463 [Rhodosporidiobolus microsporus]
MSSPSSSSDVPIPRCGMSDLTTEIKARIVKMCAEQDEHFKRWVSSKTSLVADLKKHGIMHGRSVGALFRVSKEFSTLAAPHIFKVLKASKVDLRFQYSVAKLRLPLFSELDLDDSGEAVLPILAQLSGLKTLKLKEDVLDAWWGGEIPSLDFSAHASASGQFAAMSFASLTKISELWVKKSNASQYMQLLPAFSQVLRVLRVCSSDYYGFPADVNLSAVLSSLNNLEELHLHQKRKYAESSIVNLDVVTQALTAIPPLRRLSLTFSLLHSSHLTFAEKFSSTLEVLSLDSTAERAPRNTNNPFVQPVFTTEVFPSLLTFIFVGYHAVSAATLASFQPRHAPALERLGLILHDVPTWSDDASPLANFRGFPHLTSLMTANVDPLPVPALEAIAKFCRDNDLELGNAYDEAVPIRKPSEAADKADKTDESSSSESPVYKRLIRTLDYLEATAKKAQERDDLAKLNRLTEALKGLELQRQAEEAWEGM